MIRKREKLKKSYFSHLVQTYSYVYKQLSSSPVPLSNRALNRFCEALKTMINFNTDCCDLNYQILLNNKSTKASKCIQNIIRERNGPEHTRRNGIERNGFMKSIYQDNYAVLGRGVSKISFS